MRKLMVLVFVIASAVLISANVFASGFYLYHFDSKAQGQAGAFTAQADNPSAIYYNPAGISQIDGTQLSVGAQIFRLETKYTNPQGLKQNLQAEWQPVPNAFITSDFGTEKWTFGLGLFAPFGLSTSWSDTGLLRYVCTDTSFNMFAINPTVAYQLLPELSIAAGLDYYNTYSYVSKAEYNFVIGDAGIKVDVNGDSWGGNAGLLWKPHPQHSFGLNYRSQSKIKFTGDLSYRNIPPGLGYPSSIKYDVKSEMTLPNVVNAGYAFKPIVDKLKLELDLYWVQFSKIDKQVVKERNTGVELINNPLDWEDTWLVAVGGEYMITPHWALRAGYSYQQNAVPEKTFNPNVPDANMNVIALGLGYTFDRFTIDAAYALGLYNNRNIDNTVGASVGTTVDGKYESLIHVVGVTVGCKF